MGPAASLSDPSPAPLWLQSLPLESEESSSDSQLFTPSVQTCFQTGAKEGRDAVTGAASASQFPTAQRWLSNQHVLKKGTGATD